MKLKDFKLFKFKFNDTKAEENIFDPKSETVSFRFFQKETVIEEEAR